MLHIEEFKVTNGNGITKLVSYDELKRLMENGNEFDNATLTNGRITLKKGNDKSLTYSVGMLKYKFTEGNTGVGIEITSYNTREQCVSTIIASPKDVAYRGNYLILPMGIKNGEIIFGVGMSDGMKLCSCSFPEQDKKLKLTGCVRRDDGVLMLAYNDKYMFGFNGFAMKRM